MTATANYCEACGSESIAHRQEYIAVLLDMAGLPLTARPYRFFQKHLKPAAFFQAIFDAAARRGWGRWLQEPDQETLLASQMLWQEAAARGIVMREFRLFNRPQNTFIARLPSGQLIDFDGAPLPPSRARWWVNHKPRLKKELARRGLPAPRGGAAFTQAKARALFRDIGTSVVVKPAIGSASRHTTMHVSTRDELDRAFASAKQISPLVIIEEELHGLIYRPTVVGGKLVATIRRDQPHVIGDGMHTVEELVTEANKNPARGGPYFHPIPLNDAAAAELARQGLDNASVPQKSQRVRLHQKINWALGGTTADVTDEVHPENKKMFERVAEILCIPLVGIDFIAEDISKPWQDQKCGIIECNDLPFFDNHHLPFKGQARNVAAAVWNLYLANIDP